LLTRAFYKSFGDFNRDLGYTYGAKQIGCRSAGKATPLSAGSTMKSIWTMLMLLMLMTCPVVLSQEFKRFEIHNFSHHYEISVPKTSSENMLDGVERIVI
jgi:hypothetical protein